MVVHKRCSRSEFLLALSKWGMLALSAQVVEKFEILRPCASRSADPNDRRRFPDETHLALRTRTRSASPPSTDDPSPLLSNLLRQNYIFSTSYSQIISNSRSGIYSRIYFKYTLAIYTSPIPDRDGQHLPLRLPAYYTTTVRDHDPCLVDHASIRPRTTNPERATIIPHYKLPSGRPITNYPRPSDTLTSSKSTSSPAPAENNSSSDVAPLLFHKDIRSSAEEK